jgi:ferric-dicitrate binding protein FerR (iron transport regulator)
MAGEALSPRSGRCERARQWASLRVDGELSELEVGLLERHLESCASCRAFAAGVAATTELVRATPPEKPEIAYSPPRPRVIRLPVGRRTAIAAIAAAAALGSFVGSSFQRPAPPPAPASVPQVSFLTRDLNQLRQLPHQTKKPQPAPARTPGQPPEGVV